MACLMNLVCSIPGALLILDDERLFRQSLKILLESGADIRVVADAANGQEAVTGARETNPDLALLERPCARLTSRTLP
jgi:DNA-binding NarL/FixJ family response regulator